MTKKRNLWFSGYCYDSCDICCYYYANIWWNLDEISEIDEDPIVFIKGIVDDDGDDDTIEFEYYVRKKDIVHIDSIKDF